MQFAVAECFIRQVNPNGIGRTNGRADTAVTGFSTTENRLAGAGRRVIRQSRLDGSPEP